MNELVVNVPSVSGFAQKITSVFIPRSTDIRTKDREIAGFINLVGLGNVFADPEQPYESFVWSHNSHVWVYRCIQVRARALVRAIPRQYRITKEGGRIVKTLLPPDHPAVKALSAPSEWVTGGQLREKIAVSLGITGTFFLLVNSANGTWHLRSDRTTIHPSTTKYIDRFTYEVNGIKRDFTTDQVKYFKYENPNNDFWGLSPLEAATNAVSNYLYASRWNLHYFKNAATPLGTLSTDKPINKTEANVIRRRWAKLYSGYKKAGSVAVLGGGLTYKAITPTHKDMEFLELLEFTKKEIGGAFAVPPIFLNARDEQNYSNLKEYEKMFWRHHQIPELILLQEWNNANFNPVFAGPGETIHTIYDLTQIEALQEDVEKAANAARTRIASAISTVDEERENRGEPPYPDGIGAEPMIQLSMVRLDQLGDVLSQRIGTEAKAGAIRMRKGMSRIVRGVRILKTQEERYVYWSHYKDIQNDQERKLFAIVVALATDWQNEMKRNIEAMKVFSSLKDAGYTVEDILFDEKAALIAAERGAEPVFEDTVRRAGRNSFAVLGASGSFDLHDPAVERILETRTQRFAERIAEDNWLRMKESLNEGLAAGEASKDLIARVEDNMGRIVNNGRTIARTEIHPAYEAANLEAYKQSGIVDGKEWLAAFAENSRNEHLEANEQTAPLNGAFLVWGEYLEYPGDPDGSPENIINCLCTDLPVLIEGER